MVNDVDFVVDTQLDLPAEQSSRAQIRTTTNSLNKHMATYQDAFISSELLENRRSVCVFTEAKQKQTQPEDTTVYWVVRGDGDGVQLPSVAAAAGISEAGRILKLFPRVDRRIQGSGLTHWF